MTTNAIPAAQTVSTPKRMAKAILQVLHRLLPAQLYQALYEPAFAIYQSILRRRYRREVENHRARGDLAATLRGELVHLVMPYSLVGVGGIERTHDLASDLIQRRVEGAFVECGVARGGCAALLSTLAGREGGVRQVWLFDSYEGLPDPTADDYEDGSATGEHVRPLPRGSCKGTYEEVEGLLFGSLKLNRDGINMVKGWFQDTLPKEGGSIGSIGLLRIDGDWYDSTLCCLDNLFDQVVAGGYVIIDDYESCFGAKKATDEFLAIRGLDVELSPDGRGGCSFQIPSNHAG